MSKRNKICFFFSILEAAPKSSTHSLFFKMNHFPRFQFVYNQTRDCKSRLEKFGKGKIRINKMFENVIIKIVIVGGFTDDNLRLLTESAGSLHVLSFTKDQILQKQNVSMPIVKDGTNNIYITKLTCILLFFFKQLKSCLIQSLYVEKIGMSKGEHIWTAQPHVCFEKDFFSESNTKVFDRLVLGLPNMYIRFFSR